MTTRNRFVKAAKAAIAVGDQEHLEHLASLLEIHVAVMEARMRKRAQAEAETSTAADKTRTPKGNLRAMLSKLDRIVLKKMGIAG